MNRISLAMGAGLLLSVTAPASAAPESPEPGARAAAFEAVLNCRTITDSAARLACYDGATAKMDEAQAKGDIVVVDRALATTVHREAFGLPVPSLDFLGKMIPAGDVDRIEGTVRSARSDPYGKWTMALDDGAVWRQIDGDLNRPPKTGSKVSIHRGAIGSFLMNIDGQTAIKVHRDQ